MRIIILISLLRKPIDKKGQGIFRTWHIVSPDRLPSSDNLAILGDIYWQSQSLHPLGLLSYIPHLLPTKNSHPSRINRNSSPLSSHTFSGRSWVTSSFVSLTSPNSVPSQQCLHPSGHFIVYSFSCSLSDPHLGQAIKALSCPKAFLKVSITVQSSSEPSHPHSLQYTSPCTFKSWGVGSELNRHQTSHNRFAYR